jgi:AcrR family transcriptional regulator
MNSSKAEIRKQCQRERILAAAMHCFVNHGFHAASMATIAKTAGMSPGLIYRYFDNKNAIIFTIIEAQLEVTRRRVCDMRNADDLSAAIIDYFQAHDAGAEDSTSAPLFLEMSAESTRDPEIARAVGRIDNATRNILADWFSRSPAEGGFGFPQDVARERSLALILMIDGLKARKAREPNLDMRCLKNAVDALIAAIVGP